MRGAGEGALSDPAVRMILSMSPQDGSIKPLPENLQIDPQSNGSFTVKFPDGSVRELIPGAEGEGRMISTLSDGTRIQSDFTLGHGQLSIASISSTGEKTFLSVNENGANMQQITPTGDVINVVPDNASELMGSFRETEAVFNVEVIPLEPQEDWQPLEYSDGGSNPSHFDQPFSFTPQDQGQSVQELYNGWFGRASAFSMQQDFTQQGNWQPAPLHFEPDFNQSAAFMPQNNWQAAQQYFDGWYNQPLAHVPTQQFDSGYFAPAMGFPPPPMTDASGFPIGFPEGPAHVMGEMLNHVDHIAGFVPSGFVQELDPNNQNEHITELPPQY